MFLKLICEIILYYLVTCILTDDLALSVHSQYWYFLAQQQIWDDLYGILLTIFLQCFRMLLSRCINNKLYRCTLVLIIHFESHETLTAITARNIHSHFRTSNIQHYLPLWITSWGNFLFFRFSSSYIKQGCFLKPYKIIQLAYVRKYHKIYFLVGSRYLALCFLVFE